MTRPIFLFVATCLLASTFASVAAGAPLAPEGLRVSDTPEWSGDLDGSIVGISAHPYFRVRYAAATTQYAATKLRVQLSTSETFEPMIWDSGFVSIAPTAHGWNTPAMAYTGPALVPGATYCWRAACQDDQGVSGPYSLIKFFTLGSPGSPVDLRATTGVASECLQGNPVMVVNWPPQLSAENTSESSMSLAQIEVSRNAGFTGEAIWLSSWLPIGVVLGGQRSAPISYAGIKLPVGRAYFWRIRMANEPSPNAAWSAATASFVEQSALIGSSAQAGFARESRSFGPQGYVTSDFAIGDLNGNGAPDAVLVTSSSELMHVMYPDIGTATPGAPVTFGGGANGRTLVVIGEFEIDIARNVVTVDQNGLTHYRYDNGIAAIQLVEAGGWGEPRVIQAVDANWDGWLDVVVAYEQHVVQYNGGVEGFAEGELVFETLEPITSMVVTDFNSKDDLREYWIIAGGTLSLCRNDGAEPQLWTLDGPTHLAVADSANPGNPELLFAGPMTVQRCDVSLGDFAAELTFHEAVEHGFNHPCLEVVGARLDGDVESDAVVLLQGAVLVLQQGLEALELREYVGHPGGGAVCRICVADTNLDGHRDITVGQVHSPSALHFNRQKLTASILETTANQVLFGEAYAEFEVTLSAVPVSMVVVECETYEIDPPGGDDGDGLPDPTEWLKGQVVPKPYVPTTRQLIFTPGQITKRFYVPLTYYYAGASWLLQVRITKVIGGLVGQSTATGSIYGVPQGGSGLPPAGAPPATPGLARDWTINGEVRAIVEAGTNTYIGGDFDGVSWEASGLVAFTKAGERRVALPHISSGSIKCVAVAANGSIYFGGDFTIDVDPNTQIKNIAKCNAAGELQSGFAPNPNGVVNSIALYGNGRIYFGGKFTHLAGAAGFNNIASVDSDGLAASSAFGVYDSIDHQGSPVPGNSEVLVLKIADSGAPSGATDYLLVGGKAFYKARGQGYVCDVSSFIGFPIAGSSSVVTRPWLDNAVTDIEVSTNGLIDSTSDTFAIIIGGTFTQATYTWDHTGANLAITNFAGEYVGSVSTALAAVMTAQSGNSPVSAMEIDGAGRLWVARHPAGSPSSPLVVYGISQGELSTPTKVTIGSPIWGLAAAGNEVLAMGGFSSAAGTQVSGMAAFSSVAGSVGTLVPMNATVQGGNGPWTGVATYAGGAHNGYLVCGGFNSLLAKRGNLAALNAQGQLLPWAPRTNGPVNTMTTDGSTIFFGGPFSIVSNNSRSGIAALPADDYSTAPTNWAPNVWGGAVNALAVSGDYVIIGGDFTVINSSNRTDVAAVNRFTGAVGAWNPNLQGSSGDAVHSLFADSTAIYIGGRYSGAGPVMQPGLIAFSVAIYGSPGQLQSWDPALPSGCTVTGIAATAGAVAFIGDFTQVGTEPRSGAACIDKTTAALTPFKPGA